MARYHLGWWYWNWSPRDLESAIVSFDEALQRDPFNARIVVVVLNMYRNSGDQDKVTLLQERLTQIKPESLENRRLSQISTYGRLTQLQAAFIETADEDLINDFEMVWEDWTPSEEEWHDSSIFKYSWEYQLREFRGDLDRLIEMWTDLNELSDRVTNPWRFSEYLNWIKQLLAIHWIQGESTEAESLARLALELTNQASDHEEGSGKPIFTLLAVQAYATLGELEKARGYTMKLLEERSEAFDPSGEYAIAAMSWIDVNRAAEMALEAKKKDPNWRGFDRMAANYLSAPKLIVHPDIQAYYVKDKKWISYLAERVQEYDQYKK